jgi:hypothetical protein
MTRLLEFDVEESTRVKGAESLAGEQTAMASRPRRLVGVLQRVMLRSDRGPMRSLWRLAYAITARCYLAYVRRGEPASAAFVYGSLAWGDELLPGVSDIDVVVVVAPDPAARGVARERVRRRCGRVRRALPVLGDILFGWPTVYEQADLADAVAASTLTYRLSSEPWRERTHAVYSGPKSDNDKICLAEHPQLYGPTHGWRLVAGPDRRPPPPALDADYRRIAAWLELQYWWQLAFDACVHPGQLHNASLCVKLIAEPVRIWLWLAHGEPVSTRAEALDRGPGVFPAEAEAFERARDIQHRLRSLPTAPLAELLPAFVRLSQQVARELALQVEPAGSTEVRLEWSDGDALALPDGGWAPAQPTRWDEPAPRLLPLVDWRGLVEPSLPDTFTMIDGDPGDPATLAAGAPVVDGGTYPTLSAGELQVRPVEAAGRPRLRTLQCPQTDPVSFALAADAAVAHFPDVAGFSLGAVAARAVAEHAVWLGTGERGVQELARLIGAARAALLWESIDAGEPELQLTADATLDALRARGADPPGAAEAARESYRAFAASRRPVPESVVVALSDRLVALRDCVAALPTYASSPVPLPR